MTSDFYRSLWKAAAGRTDLGKEPIFWRYFQDYGFVAFQESGENDLRRYQNKEELIEALNKKRRYTQSYRTANWLWKFKEEVHLGDIILIYSRNTIWGSGYITSDYYYERDEIGKKESVLGIPHRRDVMWTNVKSSQNKKFGILKYPGIAFFILTEDQIKSIKYYLERFIV